MPDCGSSACIAAELELGWMGTHLCWHDTGCGAGSYPTVSISADSNLGAKPGCTVLLRSLAMSCAGRQLIPERQKMMAPLPEQLLDLVCQAVVYSVVLAQQGGSERALWGWYCLHHFKEPQDQKNVGMVTEATSS